MVAFFKKKSKNIQYPSSGFTVVEMLVSISIMAIMVTIILGSRNQYTSRITLKSQVYNFVLALREAQVNSLGVTGFNNSGVQSFDVSYGIEIDSGNMAQFTYFTDANQNGKFDSGEPNRVVAFTGGIAIQRVCGTGDCFTGPTGNFRKLEIIFKRPDPSARMRFLNNGGNDQNGISPPAVVTVAFGSLTMNVTISSTGQLSLQ